MSAREKLSKALLDQRFGGMKNGDLLQRMKLLVQGYVDIEKGVAVLSDFQEDKSYIYIGSFGNHFGLPVGNMVIDSAFEDCIFDQMDQEDIQQRDLLEIAYFNFLKTVPLAEKERYSTSSRLRVYDDSGGCVYIAHRTCYISHDDAGNVLLALCTYLPCLEKVPYPGFTGTIINRATGECVVFNSGKQHAGPLSRREMEVLVLLVKGMSTREIADTLYIAVYTVGRHRQNIISKLGVANSAQAVRQAMDCGMIGL